jgi:hypothetical protein
MTSTSIYHYVYRITNVVEKKHYYGKRSSKCDPKQDLGKIYFSSSTDKEFIVDQKKNPQNYRYKIVQKFCDGKSAILRESRLHKMFSVGANQKFYNRVNQTPSGYDSTGTHINKDKMIVKDKYGKFSSLSKDDNRIISGEFVHISTGFAVVKNKNGENLKV